MKKTINFTLFLFTFVLSTYAQGVNLTIGLGMYNHIEQVIPVQNGGWLVLANTSEAEVGHTVRPRLLLITQEQNIEWSVTIPAWEYYAGAVSLYYDSLLQQCYFVQQFIECDVNLPNIIHAYDMEGNLLWDSSTANFEATSFSYSATMTSVIPGVGLMGQGWVTGSSERKIILWGADGTYMEQYALGGLFLNGIYYWKPDTLLLTRENRLYHAHYVSGTFQIYSEQVLGEEEIEAIHVLNDSVIYSKTGQIITRYRYTPSDAIFEVDAVTQVPFNEEPYHICLDEDELFVTSTPMIYTYSHDLSERNDREFFIPHTRWSGAAADNDQLLLYGITTEAEDLELNPREGILCSLSEAPLLRRDLELSDISYSEIIETQNEWGVPERTFNDIRVTIHNNGLDTVSSVQIKIQKVTGGLCWQYVGLNEVFHHLNLLPGDSTSLYLGQFSGSSTSNTLCAWVGTEAAPLETDYSNNEICMEIDVTSSLEEAGSLLSLPIYPNPSTGLIHFNNTDQWQHYRLYDAHGQLLRQGALRQGVTSVQLDITDLPAGLYHLLLDGGNTKAFGRVVRM